MTPSETYTGTTGFGQRFAVSVIRNRLSPSSTSYYVNLIARGAPAAPERRIKLTHHRLTYSEAHKFAAQICYTLCKKWPAAVDYRYGLPLNSEIELHRDHLTLLRLPSNVLHKPDSYLVPGDEIFVQCKAMSVTFFHSGLYAGNQLAYHFTTDLLETAVTLSDAMAGPGTVNLDPWMEYIYSNLPYEPSDDYTPVLYKVVYPLQVRTGEDILNRAAKLRESTIKFMYDIRRNNCQHFTSYCSVGKPFSYDMANNFKNIACSILEIGLSSRKYRDSDATRYFGYSSLQ